MKVTLIAAVTVLMSSSRRGDCLKAETNWVWRRKERQSPDSDPYSSVTEVVVYLLAVRDLDGQQDFLRSQNRLPVTGEETVVHLNHTTAIWHRQTGIRSWFRVPTEVPLVFTNSSKMNEPFATSENSNNSDLIVALKDLWLNVTLPLSTVEYMETSSKW